MSRWSYERHMSGEKARLPWKTKRILRQGSDFDTPARMRRYRRLNRPSLSGQLPFINGRPIQWYEIPVVDKLWRENRALKRMGFK